MSASLSPSVSPSESPSRSPSASPSLSPSRSPSASPSASPSPMPAGHVTYTINERIRIGKKYLVFAKLEFGSALGNDLYPSGGIALTTGSLGLRSTVNAVVILESTSSAALYYWDKSTNKIHIFSAIGTEYTANVTAIGATVLEVMAIGW